MNSPFEEDVFFGLTKTPKSLPSKYIYDHNGDQLFEAIMDLEEYYPTRCETEIIQNHSQEIFKLIGSEKFDLIEFGPGDGRKTEILLNSLSQNFSSITYIPIDISVSAIENIHLNFQKAFPGLKVKGIANEYIAALDEFEKESERTKVILFLGTSIGNFSESELDKFLLNVSGELKTGDFFLVGIDLKKNPFTILSAYNDSKGITRDFNFNLLTRINREMDANFNIANFQHYPFYNIQNGNAESFLVSTKTQKVFISKLNLTINFEAWEPIHTETSRKYSLSDLNNIADKFGFKVIKNFLDSKGYFVDTLWKRK